MSPSPPFAGLEGCGAKSPKAAPCCARGSLRSIWRDRIRQTAYSQDPHVLGRPGLEIGRRTSRVGGVVGRAPGTAGVRGVVLGDVLRLAVRNPLAVTSRSVGESFRFLLWPSRPGSSGMNCVQEESSSEHFAGSIDLGFHYTGRSPGPVRVPKSANHGTCANPVDHYFARSHPRSRCLQETWRNPKGSSQIVRTFERIWCQ
jgi:hypothetical protein